MASPETCGAIGSPIEVNMGVPEEGLKTTIQGEVQQSVIIATEQNSVDSTLETIPFQEPVSVKDAQSEKPRTLFEHISYIQNMSILQIQEHGFGLLPVAVGGAYARNIGKDTKIENYDATTHKIEVSGLKDAPVVRPFEKPLVRWVSDIVPVLKKLQTRVDFDAFVVPVVATENGLRLMTTQELQSIYTDTEGYKKACKQLELQAKRQSKAVGGPTISYEPLSYHTSQDRKNSGKKGLLQYSQFLFKMEVHPLENEEDKFTLHLYPIQEEISKESITPVRLIDTQSGKEAYFLNPQTLLFCYETRGPVKKPKDEKKTAPDSAMARLAAEFILHQQDALNYSQQNYSGWEKFHAQLSSIKVRGAIYVAYWKFIGNVLAHLPLLKLKNLFI